MLIYEVNLTVDGDIASEYSTWLREHIRTMLKLEGFEAAAWYTRSDDADTFPEGAEVSGTRHWTIHYQVDSRAHLQAYFNEQAEHMRQDGLDRFDGQFTADRRILEQRRTFSHHQPDSSAPSGP